MIISMSKMRTSLLQFFFFFLVLYSLPLPLTFYSFFFSKTFLFWNKYSQEASKIVQRGLMYLSLSFTPVYYYAKSLQSCPTLCEPTDGSPPGSPISGILQPGVGCHFLLQCMKVKSESEAAQSCQTLSDPMDGSLRSSSHGIFQARVLEWVAIAFSRLLL